MVDVASGLSRTGTVFVAGGAGMAGSAVIASLLETRPHGRIRASFRRTPPAIDDERVEHVPLELSDRHAVTAALAGCEAGILVASEGGGIRMLSNEPWRQVGPNLVLASTWLEALHDAGVRRAIVVGSATCYQPFDGAIREDQLDWNQDPSPEAFGVGWVTRAVEKLCEFWGRYTGIDIVRVRAANIYGPRARFDMARSNFIPALLRKADESTGTLEVWGSPDVTRDVIYSGDFGEAVARLLDAPHAGGRVFNVGTGRAVRVDDVVKAVLRVTEHESVPVVYTEGTPTSARSRVLDCRAVCRELNWTPATSLEDGLRETHRWWQANRATWTN
jgi:GDP-L-fucose synthase